MSTTLQNPIAAFDAAVAEQMSRGLSRSAAVRAVAVTNRELHVAYLADFNSQVRSPARADLPGGDVIALWDAAVAEEMRISRCSKAAAARTVAIQNEELRAAYCAATTARSRTVHGRR